MKLIYSTLSIRTLICLRSIKEALIPLHVLAGNVSQYTPVFISTKFSGEERKSDINTLPIEQKCT